MKKFILTAVVLGSGLAASAQKSAIQSANNYLRDKDYDHAKEYIDKAVADVSTQNDPKAWFVRGNVYAAMQDDPKYAAGSPYKESYKSYLKVIEIKPEYEKALINVNLYNNSFRFYNEGINAYNNKKYDAAIDNMKQVIAIDNLNGGLRMAEFKQLDTIAMDAKYIIGNALYIDKNYDEAIPYFVDVKNSKTTNRADIYLRLAEVYEMKNDKSQALLVIQEGRKAFPNDPSIRNAELNAYLSSGKQDELVKKLEDAVAQEPDNADLFFNLASTYQQMAEPKDASGKFLPKPANADELSRKAEAAFQKAIQIRPDAAAYFNFGALYYNQAIEVNSQMNDIKGISAAETKKYDELKAKRDALYAKSLPNLEKVIELLEPKISSASIEDKSTYRATLISLREIYASQSKMDKSAEAANKLKNMK